MTAMSLNDKAIMTGRLVRLLPGRAGSHGVSCASYRGHGRTKTMPQADGERADGQDATRFCVSDVAQGSEDWREGALVQAGWQPR